MEFGSYEYALHHRCNWVNPNGGGEVTYAGRYCVVTGTRNFDDPSDPYGWNIPGEGLYATLMYSVGDGSVKSSGARIVATLNANDSVLAILNHDTLLDQAEAMDSLEFVYGQ